MNYRMRPWLEVLAKALFWAAAAVLALAVIAAIALATGESTPIFDESLEKQGRATLAIAALGGGIVGAGILAALGAILTLLLDREQPLPQHLLEAERLRERGPES